jgi:hypothetical protein
VVDGSALRISLKLSTFEATPFPKGHFLLWHNGFYGAKGGEWAKKVVYLSVI